MNKSTYMMLSSMEQSQMMLKETSLEMFQLCGLQFINTKKAFSTRNCNLAEEVIYLEQRIIAMGLKIDLECERFIILHQPKSHDLKFVLGLRKINFGLQRIGNYCQNIAKYVAEMKILPNRKVLSKMEMEEMFSDTISMLQDISESYEDGNSSELRKILTKQQHLEKSLRRSFEVVSMEVKRDPSLVEEYLLQYTLIKKLEAMGSLLVKISEEVLFYCEAETWKEHQVQFELD